VCQTGLGPCKPFTTATSAYRTQITPHLYLHCQKIMVALTSSASTATFSQIEPFKMPKTFEKTRKEIAKKKNGNLSTLHEKSRDARKLHKAQVRDERLERLAEARKKRDQPLRK